MCMAAETIIFCTPSATPTETELNNAWPWETYDWSKLSISWPESLLPVPILEEVKSIIWEITTNLTEMIRAQAMAVWKVLLDTVDSVISIYDKLPQVIPFDLTFGDLFDPVKIKDALAAYAYETFPWAFIPDKPEWPDKYEDSEGNVISEWYRAFKQKGKEMLTAFTQACISYLTLVKDTFMEVMQQVLDLLPDPIPSLPTIPEEPKIEDLLLLLPDIPDLPRNGDGTVDWCEVATYLPAIPFLPFVVTCPPPQGTSIQAPDIDMWDFLKNYLMQFKTMVTKIILDWIETVKDIIKPIIEFPIPTTICFPIILDERLPIPP